MRKIIIALTVFAAMATSASAQIIYSLKSDAPADAAPADTKQGIGFGPEIGLNMANMAIKSGGQTTKTSFLPGLAVGVIVDYGFTKNLYLQPGLFFLMNGANISAADSQAAFAIHLNTIQLPINVEYKLGKPGGNRLFFGIGPYVAYNISGSSTGSYSTINIGSDKDKDDFKALDIGAGVNVGYQLAMGLFVRAHYQMGFLNLAPDTDYQTKYTTSGIGVTIGFLFGEKSKQAKMPKSKKPKMPKVKKPKLNAPSLK